MSIGEKLTALAIKKTLGAGQPTQDGQSIPGFAAGIFNMLGLDPEKIQAYLDGLKATVEAYNSNLIKIQESLDRIEQQGREATDLLERKIDRTLTRVEVNHDLINTLSGLFGVFAAPDANAPAERGNMIMDNKTIETRNEQTRIVEATLLPEG